MAGTNHEWLEMVDNADRVANRLDMLAALLVTADSGFNSHVIDGMDTIITEGAETIRSLVDAINPPVSSYRKQDVGAAE